MTHHLPNAKIPAPCIINTGVVVNKLDMRRLLSDLGRVRYIYTYQGQLHSEGEGDVMEVFANSQRSTLIANHALYLNISSFDYLELKQSKEKETYFDLVQEEVCLRLIPLSTPFQERQQRSLNINDLEVMMEQVLSARWDAEFDDDNSDLL
jgi:glutaminase